MYKAALALIQLACCIPMLFSCDQELTREPIALHVASPVGMTKVSTEVNGENIETFFVLNADFNHRYETASILTLNSQGQPIASLPIKRLGRRIQASGDAVWVSFDANPEKGISSSVARYQVTPVTDNNSVAQLSLDKEWTINETCSPLGLAVREGFSYFAVSCTNGELHLGSSDDSKNHGKLSHIRTIKGPSRLSMVFDTQRQLLYSFATDVGAPRGGDLFAKDSQTWNDTTKELLEGVNDIPDEYEKAPFQRARLVRSTSSYQFHIFALLDPNNIDQDGDFIYRDFKTTREEFHWLYFSVLNEKGLLDRENEGAEYVWHKHYRTNFADAQLDPHDSEERSILLLHRGGDNASDGNQVIRMRLNDNYSRYEEINQAGVLTSELFSFERVYGFGHQEQENKPEDCTYLDTSEECVYQRSYQDYLQSFQLTEIGDQKYMFVNHFRPNTNFKDPKFTLNVFPENERETNIYRSNAEANTFSSTTTTDGLYGFTVSANLASESATPYVHVFTNQFFKDTVQVFRFSPGEGFSTVNTIQ
ncbi:MAG: hypothetical protein OXT67_04265 [Zetaproteobacteria bacterium]|nr:hypothetical protein [Zetaproteobacteria bacterium]